MCRLPRYIPAFVLIVLYAMISLSPLAPLALRSPVLAHALTGECALDCSICGCSVERSANHTCCCWQKKLQHEEHDDNDEPECCKKIHAEEKKQTAFRCPRPCNSGKSMTWGGVPQTDVIPFHFHQAPLAVIETALVPSPPVCYTEWSPLPPEPPPKVTSLS